MTDISKPISGLSAVVLRNLGDRSYEKRKQAALDIELLIKDLNEKGNSANNAMNTANNNSNNTVTIGSANERRMNNEIYNVIRSLVDHYINSLQANFRKGGLIALAACAIALKDDISLYLQWLVPPVLKLFADPEGRVRYYACEALYNMSKVAKGSILLFFNEIFDGLHTLCLDPMMDVRNGASILDRLLKDVVTESDSFNVEKFIPLLRERIANRSPPSRKLIIGWINTLLSVPNPDMLRFLPQYLGGIFDMLSDGEKDIRNQAYIALADLMKEIKNAVQVELGPMMLILVAQCESQDKFARLTGLSWMKEFIQLGQTKLFPFCADILGALLQCISDSEDEIRNKADATNDLLLHLVESTSDAMDIPPLLAKLTTQVRSKWVATQLASLRWMIMLLNKIPQVIYSHLEQLYPALFQTLSDPEEQVVRMDLEVLALISRDNANFDQVLNKLMQLFAERRNLLETRGSLIIRQLCVLRDAESIYCALSRILGANTTSSSSSSSSTTTTSSVVYDLEFTSLMIQTLNLILLTSSELLELRVLIKKSLVTNDGRKDLFITLYQCWIHNPVSTFSLCLLAQAYELACALAFQMADIEVSVALLMQIDKLVQLIESPIFIHLRLQLLEPQRHPFLVKSLYGLLMLLPQSPAYSLLKSRLESVSPLNQLQCPESKFAVSQLEPTVKQQAALQFSDLLEQFKTTQERHTAHRRELFRQHRQTRAVKDNDDRKD